MVQMLMPVLGALQSQKYIYYIMCVLTYITVLITPKFVFVLTKFGKTQTLIFLQLEITVHCGKLCLFMMTPYNLPEYFHFGELGYNCFVITTLYHTRHRFLLFYVR